MTDNPSKHPVARLRQPEGGEFLLYPERAVRLGRSSENDIVLNDPKISRRHALIEWNGSGFSIHDLGSSNGTQVNHERVLDITGRALRDGDQITIHKHVLIFEIVRVESSEPITEPKAVGTTGRLAARGPRLVVTAGPDEGDEYPLWGEQITVGRASREQSCEIRLTDPSISRQHFRIEQREDGCYLVDLNSANGSLLNDIPVEQPTLLSDGDRIEIGQTTMLFYHTKEKPVV